MIIKITIYKDEEQPRHSYQNKIPDVSSSVSFGCLVSSDSLEKTLNNIRKLDKQIDRQTDRQTHRQTHSQTQTFIMKRQSVMNADYRQKEKK